MVTPSNECVRVVKETGLRSVGSHLVGSNPTARNRRCSSVVEHPLCTSEAAVGRRFGSSLRQTKKYHDYTMASQDSVGEYSRYNEPDPIETKREKANTELRSKVMTALGDSTFYQPAVTPLESVAWGMSEKDAQQYIDQANGLIHGYKFEIGNIKDEDAGGKFTQFLLCPIDDPDEITTFFRNYVSGRASETGWFMGVYTIESFPIGHLGPVPAQPFMQGDEATQERGGRRRRRTRARKTRKRKTRRSRR